MKIENYIIDQNSPVFIIAELSANHYGNIETTIETIKAAKRAGDFTEENIKSIRPAFGLYPKYYKDLINKKSKQGISRISRLNINNI